MKLFEVSITLVIASLACSTGALATPGLQTAEEIAACNEANLPETSSVQTVRMQVTNRAGAITESKATIHWKRFDDGLSGVLVRLSEPEDVRGSAFLMLEKKKRNHLFIYLPELGRVKRVSGRMMSTSIFGTNISYEEFEHLQSMS